MNIIRFCTSHKWSSKARSLRDAAAWPGTSSHQFLDVLILRPIGGSTWFNLVQQFEDLDSR